MKYKVGHIFRFEDKDQVLIFKITDKSNLVEDTDSTIYYDIIKNYDKTNNGHIWTNDWIHTFSEIDNKCIDITNKLGKLLYG